MLDWREVVQKHAQNIAGKARRPIDMAPAHWDAVADDLEVNRRELRLLALDMVDRMIAARMAAEADAIAAGAGLKLIAHLAEMIENHALRIATRVGVRARA